ncbi:MAG: YdcF family protein [Spirochaetales bacterium]|nr:YdcF family protein [Spirochaetales bacterium]
MAESLSLRISLIILAGITALFLVNHEVNSKYRHRIFPVTEVQKRYVCMVLGASVWKNKLPSHILEDRLRVGIALYEEGRVEKLLLSGDHGRDEYDEVNVMKNYVASQGIDVKDIFTDHAGFRTYDSLYRARDVFGIKSLIIVTNSFHLPRALYIANRLGIDAIGVPSDLRIYQTQTKNKVREFFARILAFVDINITKPLPRYLGTPIDIHGSGSASHD